MSEVKVSVVVPVYNREKYLKECLDSLLNQTLQDIEIVCVDDGSTDKSFVILDEYQKKDSRIKTLRQRNKGVSRARNLGISKAQGEYLLFVDSDDFLEKTALENLYNEIVKKNCEILLFSFYRYQNNCVVEDFRLRDITNTDLIFKNDYNELICAPQTVYAKMYKTAFIKNNDIFFPKNIQCGEDRYFAINTYINASKISIFNKPFYYYRIDNSNSLSKQGLKSIIDTFKVNKLIKDLIYKKYNLENKEEIYKKYLDNSTDNILNHWSGIYTFHYKKYNFKYLKLLKKEYVKNGFITDEFKELNSEIEKYQNLFISKLLEPVIEIVKRRERINLYLFENLVLNFSTRKISDCIFKIRYLRHLLKLKLISKSRKIKVAFYVSEIGKWCGYPLYESLKNSDIFKPVIFISAPKKPLKNSTIKEIIEENVKYFSNNNMDYELLYNLEKGQFTDIKKANADIIFYQQPWQIPLNQNIFEASKKALVCYFPYCFYSMITDFNYFSGFHGKMWKYFVETEFHKIEYEKRYKANNCIALGSVKLDNYKNISKNRQCDKKTIIYAPHHSFDDSTGHNTATFLENGDYILELARKYNDINWIIRPHPEFCDRLLKTNKKTKEQIDEYFREWEKIGTISKLQDNYFEQFVNSDCLITDSISFLAEYLPVNKPVLHLRNKKQTAKFNKLIESIIEGYYQIHNNDELSDTFSEVILSDNDYKKEIRKEKIKLLMIDENKSVSDKITDFLKKEFKIGF